MFALEMRDIPELQKSIALKATNPFVVLTQGFDDIAGKPLFERNVPPKKYVMHLPLEGGIGQTCGI